MRATSHRFHRAKAALTAALMPAAFMTAVCFAPTAFAHDVEDDGPQAGDIEQVHALTDFDKIDIRGVYRLKVTVGEDFRVFTSGPPKEVKRMKVYREGGTLVLGQDEDEKKYIGKRQGIWAEISLPALNALEVTGVGTGDITGVDAKYFEMDIKGVGDLELSGRCGTLDADMKGVGSIDARELKCAVADVRLKGVGEVSVSASDAADINAKGIGSVDVYGSPKKVEKSKGFLSGVTIH